MLSGFRFSFSTVALLGALLLALALDLRVALRGDAPQPNKEEIQAAKVRLLELKKPGDLLFISPLFPLSVGAALEGGRPDRPPKELLASRRVLLLDRRDHPVYVPDDPQQAIVISDLLVLKVFEPETGSPLVVFDLVASWQRATLRIERPPGTVATVCDAPRPAGGRDCPGQPGWLYLAPATYTISGKSEACLWAHPTTGGVLAIEIPASPDPPAGRRLMLEVQSAMHDDAVRGTPDGASVQTEIRQEDQAIGTITLPNQVGWFSKKVPIRSGKPVELRVSTEHDGRRHHCLRAEIREEPAS